MTNCSKWKNEWSFSFCFFTRSVSCSIKKKDHQKDFLMTYKLDIVARENISFTKVFSVPQSLKSGYGTVSILRAWPEWFEGESLMAQTLKNLPAMWETWVWSLGWVDPLRRTWQPTTAFLPGESHGLRSLVGYSSWGHRESDITEYLSIAQNLQGWKEVGFPLCVVFFFFFPLTDVFSMMKDMKWIMISMMFSCFGIWLSRKWYFLQEASELFLLVFRIA